MLLSIGTTISATQNFHFIRGKENSSTSTFVHNIGSGSIAFAVTVAKDDEDIFFHLEAPAEYSWFGVGTGEKMDGSLMWIAYRNGNGTGKCLASVTLSL